MSIQYNLFKLAVKASGVKKRIGRPPEDLVRLSREAQAKNPFSLPKDDDEFVYEDHPIDNYHCIRMHPRAGAGDRAVLYVYGGGMMTPPATRYLTYAKNMARFTGADVWFPRYPLCSDATILEAVQMVYGVWRQMDEAYEPGNTAFYGFSSGASLLLSALLLNAEQESPLANPALFVGIAPGGCPADETEMARMRELDPLDIEVSASFMDAMRALMTKGDEQVPSYMVDGTGGRWDALPPTHLYYGSREVLSAKAPAFERKLTEAGVPHSVTVRDDMCHCYCIDPKFPEAQADYDEIMMRISNALGAQPSSTEPVSDRHAKAGSAALRPKHARAQSGSTFWDRTAFAYDFAMKKGDEGIAEATRYISSFAKPLDIVLDAACGTGAFACGLAPAVELVAACDLSTNMLERARAKAERFGIDNIAFGVRDITALDFDNDTFDLAVAGNVLHLLDDPQQAIDELSRVVKPGGMIAVPNYFVDGKPADERFVKAASVIGFPLKQDWSREDILSFLEGAGLDVVENRTFQGARPLCVAICKVQ